MLSIQLDKDNEYLSSHFQTEAQEKESCTLGMWLFLAQETMFFGGMFVAYGVYRYMYFDAWVVGSAALDWRFGAGNTVVLLLSSFTAAMAVYYAQTGKNKKVVQMYILTVLLGLLFLYIKWTFEWPPKITHGVLPGNILGYPWSPDAHHYPDLAAFPHQGQLQLFFCLYFIMTGMHALHMVIGFIVLLPIVYRASKGYYGPRRYMQVEFFGLYWHFVDIVWVFLFPMFYLVT